MLPAILLVIASVALFSVSDMLAKLLQQLLQDRRAMDPSRFAYLRRELGLETLEDTAIE